MPCREKNVEMITMAAVMYSHVPRNQVEYREFPWPLPYSCIRQEPQNNCDFRFWNEAIAIWPGLTTKTSLLLETEACIDAEEGRVHALQDIGEDVRTSVCSKTRLKKAASIAACCGLTALAVLRL